MVTVQRSVLNWLGLDVVLRPRTVPDAQEFSNARTVVSRKFPACVSAIQTALNVHHDDQTGAFPHL
jgi:hypothetical protein